MSFFSYLSPFDALSSMFLPVECCMCSPTFFVFVLGLGLVGFVNSFVIECHEGSGVVV